MNAPENIFRPDDAVADAKVHTTFFEDKAAKTCRAENLTLTELQELVLTTAKRKKDNLPWLKFAVFGKKPSDKNSLRHDANVLQITGIELDYDGEKISFDDAVKAVRAMGISALAYTSPSN